MTPGGRSKTAGSSSPLNEGADFMNQQPDQPGLFVGIDWADQKHDIYVIDRRGKGMPDGASTVTARPLIFNVT